MNFKKRPLETIKLTNHSIVKKMHEGIKGNWIFIPGGPGLGEEYLEDILDKSTLAGNLYIYQFPVFDSQISDESVLINIRSDFHELCSKIDNPIFIAHSFGGMLIQSIGLSEDLYSQIIILCSSPNLDCFKFSSLAFEKFSNEEKALIIQAENAYTINKSNITFKALFQSWAPFYVEKKDENTYLKMLEKCTFNHYFYDWGERYFYSFFEENGKLPKKAIAIGSLNDKICPIGLFDFSNLETISINSFSHFPWVENSESFNNILKKIEFELLSGN